MKTSPAGVTMIKRFESCRLHAYTDVANNWTIGWGHVSVDIHQGVVWTQAKCDEQLVRDLIKFENALNGMLTVELNQNQYDSLIDFVYNAGPGNLEKSTLLKKVNESDFEGASKQFGRWAHSNGKLIPALVKRRAYEKDLFMSS